MATASPAIHAADQRSGSINPSEQVTQQTPANSVMAAIVGHTPGLLRTRSAERKTVIMATIRIDGRQLDPDPRQHHSEADGQR